MDIIEGNKLIQQFTGDKIATGEWGENWKKVIDTMVNTGVPNYHESWDWLMPVVEKIEKLEGVKDFQICQDWAMISVKIDGGPKKFFDTPHRHPLSKILSVWHPVVAFIQWYNQQTESTRA